MSHVIAAPTVTLTVAGGAGGAGPVNGGVSARRLDSIHYIKPGSGGYTGTANYLWVTDEGIQQLNAAGHAVGIDDPGGSPVYTHDTADFNDAGANDVQPFPTAEAIGDQFCVGFRQAFTRLRLNIGTAATTGSMTWRYWNGSSWAALSGVTDGTANMTNAGEADVVWAEPSDWVARVIDTSEMWYFVAAELDGTFTGSDPLITQGWVEGGQPIVDGVDISGGSQVFRFREPSHDISGAEQADYCAHPVTNVLKFELTGDASDGETGSVIAVFGGAA